MPINIKHTSAANAYSYMVLYKILEINTGSWTCINSFVHLYGCLWNIIQVYGVWIYRMIYISFCHYLCKTTSSISSRYCKNCMLQSSRKVYNLSFQTLGEIVLDHNETFTARLQSKPNWIFNINALISNPGFDCHNVAIGFDHFFWG